LELNSFEADFTQTITDDKDKVLKYSGHISASKPNDALWQYKTPVDKSIYIGKYEAVIVEPEIEQVIIRRINSEFDFFKMIKRAKELSKGVFTTTYNNKTYLINTDKGLVSSISFLDQFENKVKISFSNQKQNHKIDQKIFIPKYPMDFDIIND
jgi:outer membrane lipoprotein carrier protein